MQSLTCSHQGPTEPPRDCTPVPALHPTHQRGHKAASQAQTWRAFKGCVCSEAFPGHSHLESWPRSMTPLSWRSVGQAEGLAGIAKGFLGTMSMSGFHLLFSALTAVGNE